MHVVAEGGFEVAPPLQRSSEDGKRRRPAATRILSTLIVAVPLILAAALAYVVTKSGATEGLLPVAAQTAAVKASTSPPFEATQLAQSGAPMPAQPPPATAQPVARPPIPDVAGLVVLIRNAVIALQQANSTGNYSVLREIAAPRFQEANSAARLIEIFTDLRSRNLDLGVVANANPRLYRDPIIDDQGMLRLVGSFPTTSEQVDFDLVFQMIESRWRLFGIGLNPTAPANAVDPKGSDSASQAKPAQKPKGKPGAKPALPDATTMVVLIRGAVIALNQANMTGNYSVLRDMSAPGFQLGNSFAKISTIFADLRKRHLDLGPVAAIDARLFRAAAIDSGGLLRLTGYFASRPEQVNFDLAFQMVEGRWLLFGIGLNTSREEPGSAGLAISNPEAADAKNPSTQAPPKPRPRPAQ